MLGEREREIDVVSVPVTINEWPMTRDAGEKSDCVCGCEEAEADGQGTDKQ